MTFDQEKALVDAGYTPTFSQDWSRITGWSYPNKNFVLTLASVPTNATFNYSSQGTVSATNTFTIDTWTTLNLNSDGYYEKGLL